MKSFKMLLIAVVLMGLAVGCSTTSDREDMLLSAGFRMEPVDTPARQARFNSLPADKFTSVVRDGTTYYTFPDPKRNMLYVGQERQYRKYRDLRQQKQMADEQLEAAQMNENDWATWGTWGGPVWAWR